MKSTAKKPKSAKSKRVGRRESARDSTLRRLLMNDEAVGFGAIMRIGGTSTVDALIPPGSILDAVVRALRRETDCPPELGVVTTFAVVSAALCQAGSSYHYHDDPRPIHPALWNVALAESGAGKTFVRNVVTRALGIDLPTIPTPGSAQALIDSLAATDGVGYWDKDEYGQTIKQISRDSTAAKTKDFLLLAYDHQKLSDSTRTHGLIEVGQPVLCIYGSTPDGSLSSCLDAEMLVDGFAARHMWSVMDPRPLEIFRYNGERVRALIAQHPAIDNLRGLLKERREYVITESAETELSRRFKETITDLGGQLKRGFVRRITWTAGHYALLYHLLTQRFSGERIGVNAARWAWRMVMYHLHSTRHVLTLADPGVANKIQRMTLWIDQQRATGATGDLERRFLQRFSRDVSSITEARQMLSLCGLRK